jgi:peptidoglycan/xylan/chitin deacetylase (PgdA/CDA1 family)
VTDDEVWRPGVDPNAETQRAWPEAPGGAPGKPGVARVPGASIPPQGGSRDGVEPLAETRLAVPGQFDAPAGSWEGSGFRPSRRRVLFAAGGVILLAGAGAAVAAAVEGGGKGSPLASGGGPGASGAGVASASPRSGASAGASASPTGQVSGSPSASPSGTGGAVATKPQYYIDDQGPMAIALTMDDGPTARYTPQVLDILAQHGIKATFNMIGQQIGGNKSLVREVSAAGHTITNHTWDHSDQSKLPLTQILSQIDRCNEALADVDQHPTIFRAPYGNWSPAVYEACAQRNLRPVDWSIDPRDWDTGNVSTQQIVQYVVSKTRAHDIILEHDGGGDRSHTVAALKQFIPQLLEKGFHFVAM